jgi:RimJ/RimL family protein N-acetyltransferase
MDPQPVLLEGRVVRLEPLTPGHAVELFAALSLDPAIWQWLSPAAPRSLEEMAAKIAAELAAQAQGSRVQFAQIERESNRAAGQTSYLNISRPDRGLEIGSTWLGKPWQRSGINTEAKYLLLRHAFETLGAVRVQLKTDRRNLTSQRAIERLGALKEGVLRKHMLVQAGFIRDSVMYSILDDEWPAVKARLETFMSAHS